MSQHKTHRAAVKPPSHKAVRVPQSRQHTSGEPLNNSSKGWLIAFALLVIVVLFFIIRAAVNS